MSESPLESKPIICEEVFDEHSVPSEEEVIEYAKKIGINPKCEPHLLPIAFQGLMQPLPKGWKPCLDASINRWYYYNKVTKVSQWEHPLDSVYRDLVKRGRSEGYSSAAEDDSKGTAREGDLKSLEEVSDLVPSSKSNEPPPPPSLKNNNNVVSSPSASIETDMKPHEPLLLRRKQMQSGLPEQQDGQLSSLQIAKMMNNAMKEKTALVFETEESTYSIPPSRTSSSVPVTPKQLQPIRRAKTLDPIPNYGQSKGPPIKGILRESSFSGLPNKIVQGTHPDKGQDEEEKKRSVRFADSERKLLDIRFSDSEEDSLSENDDSLSESESDGSDDQDSEKESQNKAKVFNRLNLNAEGIKLINKKLEAINVSQIKDKLLNSPSNVKPLESSSSDESDDCNDPVAVTPPRFNKPKSPQSPLHSEGQKTGRFTVSKSPVDRLPSTPLLFDVKSQPSVTDVTQISDKGDSEKGEVVTVICQERPLLLDKNLSREPSEEDLKTSEMEDIARKKTSERLAALEERLSREIVEKVAKMKEEQAQRLDIIRDELAEKETIEKANIIKEHNEKLAQIKLSLQQELADKENDLKQKHQQELDALLKKLENDRDAQKMAALARHESLVASAKQEETDRFNAEKARLEAESNVELMKRQEMLNAEIQTLKDEEETKLMKIKSDGISQVDDLKKRYEALIKEEENKYLDELNKIQTEHTVKLSDVKIDKEADLRRVQTEWEDKIKAAELQHRSTLDSTVTNHETSMASLRLQLVKQEETLKREHAERIEAWNSRLKRLTDREPGGVQSANRDYEKMRCEKRLIEDKYRSLKDKYIQLKTDMKIAVERKIQSRARRRKEEISRIEKEVDKKDKNKSDRNANTVSEMSDKAKPFNTTPRINVVGHFQLKDCHDNDVLSDDQFTSLTTSTLPNDDQKSSSSGDRRLAAPPRKRLGRSRFGVESVRDGGDGAHQGNVLDDVKSQLQELEQIEEQIPAQSQGETYLRYPFEGSGLSTSAEVDFYRHRVIVEQEAVRAARECLLQQKRELEARQSILRTNNNTSTMQQLQQQERDLTEMEVSLHRTRALLGEKMIRLRLLGQTLNRLVDDSPSPTSHSAKNDPALSPSVVGFPAETVPFNVLQNLENINSEIREIWSQLGKQQTDGTTPEEPSMATYTKPIPTRSSSSMKPLRRLPSNRADIEARIQGLREWLQKPPSGNIDWSQLTL